MRFFLLGIGLNLLLWDRDDALGVDETLPDALVNPAAIFDAERTWLGIQRKIDKGQRHQGLIAVSSRQVQVLRKGVSRVSKHIEPEQTRYHQSRFLIFKFDAIELRFRPFASRSQWLIELEFLAYRTSSFTLGKCKVVIGIRIVEGGGCIPKLIVDLRSVARHVRFAQRFLISRHAESVSRRFVGTRRIESLLGKIPLLALAERET